MNSVTMDVLMQIHAINVEQTARTHGVGIAFGMTTKSVMKVRRAVSIVQQNAHGKRLLYLIQRVEMHYWKQVSNVTMETKLLVMDALGNAS